MDINVEQKKIDSLCEDFLQRNGDHFTSVRRSGRIGWESTLPEGSAYSEAMLSVRSKEELHKVAYSHARDMIVAMNIPFRVKISLADSESCTDGKTVWVATDMFDDGSLTTGQIIDIFTGLAIHEGCHLLYTDMSLIGKAKNRLVADLFNIIEDERIEMLCGEERPGLANFLGCTKYYYFDRYSSGRSQMERKGGLSRLARLINSILSIIRYPKALEMEDAVEFADTLLEVKKEIMPYPKTCRQALNAAERIYEIIRRFDEDEREKERKDPDGRSSSGEGREQAASSQRRRRSRNRGMSQGEYDMIMSVKDTLEAIEKEIAQLPNGRLEESRMSQEVKKDGCRLARSLAGDIEIGKVEKVNIHPPVPDRDRYEESRRRVARYVPAMAGILRSNGADTSLELRGLRSGSLDTNRLPEAIQGVESIYRRETVVMADRIAVCVLVDESGSMAGEKIEAARDTAVLLNEALMTVRNIDLFIYGHTTEAESFVKFTAYREPDARCDRYALGGIDSYRSNVDSLAIREAAGRIRRKTQEKCLFFIISDGAPCEPKSNVRTAVRELSKDGFTFISVGIDFGYDPREMYDNHISLTDMSRLAPELGKVVKKSIMKRTRR